jgi:hypothetical protein
VCLTGLAVAMVSFVLYFFVKVSKDGQHPPESEEQFPLVNDKQVNPDSE